MTIYNEAWQAGIDAVVADNTLNRTGFVDAIRTIITQAFTFVEGRDLVDAVAVEFNRLGLINNPSYNNLRGDIISDPVAHRALFDALGSIGALPELIPALQALRLIDLRDERDNIGSALDRFDVLIAAEPNGTIGRLVKDGMRGAKGNLRQLREQVRDQIRGITGDPDA